MNYQITIIDKIRLLRRVYYSATYQSRVNSRFVSVQEKLPKCFPLAVSNFSIDYELFWGNAFYHSGPIKNQKRINQAIIAKNNSLNFYALIEELEMKCTWSVLGKLIAPDLAPTLELQFSPTWYKSDWYKKPEADITIYKANEFVRLLSSNPNLEILSHGFAHIDFADPCVTKQIAIEDLRIAKLLLQGLTSTEKVFFYPCNKVKHEDAAYDLGYRITRGQDNHWHIPNNGLVKTLIGFWISPAMISLSDAKKIIDLGIKNKSFIHPWMHLIELNINASDLDLFYRPLFLYLQAQEIAGNLEILTFENIEKRISTMNEI